MSIDKKKEEKYIRLYNQIAELISKTDDIISRMSTIAAVLKNKIPSFSWCGIYFVKSDCLTVGPYQGPLACLVLKNGGVCYESVKTKQTVLVSDVTKFAGHIACDENTKSEIVVPIFDKSNNLYAVLDIDSYKIDNFDNIDKLYLEKIASLINKI